MYNNNNVKNFSPKDKVTYVDHCSLLTQFFINELNSTLANYLGMGVFSICKLPNHKDKLLWIQCVLVSLDNLACTKFCIKAIKAQYCLLVTKELALTPVSHDS